MSAAISRSSVRHYRVSRLLTFGPAIALPLWGWEDLGQPLHWAGLAGMVLAALLIIPMTLLVILFFLPAALRGGLVPRQWRINYRARHGREGARSAYISKRLRAIVFAADRHRCVVCKSTLVLNADHVRPWQPGGLTTLFNLMTLCRTCNLVKLNYWRERSGYVWYRPDMRTPERLAQAAAILRVERRKRWRPLRLLRAAWALG